ncbi:MAG: ABC transporter substrate-binding protein [Planctomycetaceae bacterium]|jgi:NitT/TauT family transport system substrate-binding protein|nr:ABC transporter substrate-binding protein [Planctomycetaceae bacterium]
MTIRCLTVLLLAVIMAVAAEAADKFRIGYIAEPAHGLHFIADKKGYFKEEGIAAELFQFSTTAEGVGALKAGKLEVGTFGTAAPLLFIARGADFTIFAGMMIEGQAIIAKPENVNLLKDLKSFKGKTVALGKLTTGDVIFRGALKKAGIDPNKDIKVLEFPGQSAVVEAVRKGAVDAGIVFAPHYTLAEKKYGLKVSNYIADFHPDYTCCRLVANTKDFNAKKDAYKRFLIAIIRAYKFYKVHHDETVKIISSTLKIEEDVVRKDTYTNATFQSNPDPLTDGTLEFWNIMTDIGYLPENNVKLLEHIDTTVYRQALDEVLKRYPNDPVYQQMEEFFEKHNTLPPLGTHEHNHGKIDR